MSSFLDGVREKLQTSLHRGMRFYHAVVPHDTYFQGLTARRASGNKSVIHVLAVGNRDDCRIIDPWLG